VIGRLVLITGISFIFSLCCKGQETVAPLGYNPLPGKETNNVPLKTTALTLPFFEDFIGYGVYPDPGKWVDKSVYVNNTMAVQPVSRGVATFDALNYRGGPYDSVNANALIYADSLTSQPIDLSGFTASSNIYLSFFYQPQGNGFAPEQQDSLMLFMKKGTVWTKVWAVEGTTVHAFKQVILPVNDAGYFTNEFQFRFVNKASININDDVWNVDYIRLAANRNANDTAINDVATTVEPSFILNDYTSMPYRQFAANMSNELASQHSFWARNSYGTAQSIVYGFTARETTTNTPISSGGPTSATMPAYSDQQFQFPMYSINFVAPDLYSRVVIENKYYSVNVSSADYRENDTIVRQQVFDNYLAYDDGTAEKSYFLHQFATLPAMTAIEFHLNQPDTLRGVAIYFGRQVPLASNKFFSVGVYKDIAVNGGTDNKIFQQDLLFASYADTVNHFWVYKFDSPVPMSPGTFFLGTIQPANSGSDSLYLGLDVNRVGGNHLYVNYLNVWQPSVVGGALMIRPLLGQPVIGTSVKAAGKKETEWSVFPNPTKGVVHVKLQDNASFTAEVLDAQGRVVIRSEGKTSQSLDLSPVTSGIYFVRVISGGQVSAPKKIIKL
jgi:hypothetical protein